MRQLTQLGTKRLRQGKGTFRVGRPLHAISERADTLLPIPSKAGSFDLPHSCIAQIGCISPHCSDSLGYEGIKNRWLLKCNKVMVLTVFEKKNICVN